MPIYEVREKRCFDCEYTIVAEDERAARDHEGEILEESEPYWDSYGESVESVTLLYECEHCEDGESLPAGQSCGYCGKEADE